MSTWSTPVISAGLVRVTEICAGLEGFLNKVDIA